MIDRPSCAHSTELWNADRVWNADDAVYSPASCRTAPVPILNRDCPAFAQIAADGFPLATLEQFRFENGTVQPSPQLPHRSPLLETLGIFAGSGKNSPRLLRQISDGADGSHVEVPRSGGGAACRSPLASTGRLGKSHTLTNCQIVRMLDRRWVRSGSQDI